MFPLAGKNFPGDSGELADSIRDALENILTLPSGSGVKVEGKFPAVKKLTGNLNNATVSATEPPPKPKPSGKRQGGIDVAQLEIQGHPIKYERNKLDLGLKARDVHFDFARDKKGQPLLVLTDAGEGQVDAKITKQDIRSLLLTAAREVGKQQKIGIADLQLTLS